MKYSFMSFSTPELSLEETLALAVQFGYDGIEPRVGCAHRHGIEYAMSGAERRQARVLAAQSGIAFSCVATSCWFADPEVQTPQRADLSQAIALAGDLGAPCIRVFGGQLGTGMSRDDGIAQVADALSAAAEQAAQCQVVICLETHDAWCDPAHVAAVMRRVDHPAIGVNWDIMHPVRMGFAGIDESFALLQPWIRHLHIHDGTGGDELVLLPIGQGIIDHYRTLELLQQAGYAGYLSGEWIGWEPAEIHLPRELATMKAYEAKIHQ